MYYGDIPTATDDDVLAFCNKVRKAGGANPLDALMPGIPENPESCLIARNLNFSCKVMPAKHSAKISEWYMQTSPEVVNELVQELGLKRRNDECVWLPPEIASVAYEFDQIHEVESLVEYYWFKYLPSSLKEQLEREYSNPYQTAY